MKPAPPARLCIFTRVPVLGRVKQRLAADLGAEGGLRAHTMLVEDALARLAAVPGVVSELWIDAPPESVARRWSREWSVQLRVQQGHDLGGRMAHALEASLGQSPFALVVGTDCPAIDAGYVTAAVNGLGDHDVVLGPAEDGGYGLVGARAAVRAGLPVLFEGVAWGTSGVLEATLERAAAADLDVLLLPAVWDVDTLQDWHRYLAARGGTAR